MPGLNLNNGHVGQLRQRILGRRRGAKWYYAAPPLTGNGPGPEL